MTEFDNTIMMLLQQHNDNLYAVSNSLIDDLLIGKSKNILEYALYMGIIQIRRKCRKDAREKIKQEVLAPIQTIGMKKNEDIYRGARKAIQKRTEDLLVTWMIGDLPIGEFNKAGLLLEAQHERKSSDGHLFYAEVYSRLAEPMNDVQLVKDHWKSHGVQLLRQEILDNLLKKKPIVSAAAAAGGFEARPNT